MPKKHNGQCLTAGAPPCGGYVPIAGWYEHGGCQSPGNSAFDCKVRSVIDTFLDARFSDPFTNSCGNNVSGSCDYVNVAIVGLQEGYSSPDACDYCRVVVSPSE